MGPHSVYEYAASLRPRYRLASRRDKSRLLDEFCRITTRHRKVAIALLRHRPKRARRRAGRPSRYPRTLRPTLEQVWELSDHLCSKRLAPFLPALLEALERHDEVQLSPEQRTALLQISPATIDRLLRPVRRLHRRHGLATTSSSLAALRTQVPLRTFTEWGNVPPGHLQADLLAHCGETTHGFYLTSLLAVDVATGWTELEAVWGKGHSRVGVAVRAVRRALPVPLLSLHTDNGGGVSQPGARAVVSRAGHHHHPRPAASEERSSVRRAEQWGGAPPVYRLPPVQQPGGARSPHGRPRPAAAVRELLSPRPQAALQSAPRGPGTQAVRSRADALPAAAGERRPHAGAQRRTHRRVSAAQSRPAAHRAPNPPRRPLDPRRPVEGSPHEPGEDQTTHPRAAAA